MQLQRNLNRLLLYAVAVFLAVVFLAPLVSALRVAVTPTADLFRGGFRLWPRELTWEHFRTMWSTVPFFTWYLNSLKVASLFTIGQLFSCSLTAYAIARLRFPGRGVLSVVILATMMLPFQALMIPLFILMKNLGWIDSHLPLWVPAFFGDITGAFGIFLLRQAFLAVPEVLADAARVDGASPWQVFARIFMPLVRPHLAVLAVFSFMNSWNDFIRPIVYITNPARITVTGGLSFFQTAWHVEWGPIMAGTALSLVPTLLLYLVAQRYFVQAVTSTGIKG